MELQYLREFVTLERISHYTRAADALYTTEATLSRHIKTMEKELGQPLFLRTTRRVELTQFGEKFLIYAKKLVSTWEECETNLLKKDINLGERLMIGIFGLISPYGAIREALCSFSTLHPNCAVGTVQGDLMQLKEKLLKREYDLAIVRESMTEPDDLFGRINIMKEPLCVVAPKDNPLVQEKEVDVRDLKGCRVTLPSEFMLSHQLFVDLCRRNDFEPQVRSLLREREFMENLISLGGNVAILCENMAQRSVNTETQTVRKIKPLTYEYVNLLYRKTGEQPEIIRDAIRCFEHVSGRNA